MEHCREAIKKGLTEICFTNHQEWISAAGGFYDYAMRNTGWEKLISDIETARKQFPTLTIKLGCEIGHYPQYATEIIRFAGQYPFDYIIGSIHALEDKPIDIAPFFDTGNTALQIKRVRQYFSAIKEMVDHAYFDCVGHLDITKKHLTAHDVEEYQDLIWDIAHSMKKNDIGFELNTSGWRHPIKECYPSSDIIKILKNAGVRKVTIGSDSHSPGSVGQDIQKGLEFLSQNGFDAICTFSRRIPTYHPLIIS